MSAVSLPLSDDATWPRSAAVTRLMPWLLCASLWVLFHPYIGIVNDSALYMGRVMADLDPQGLGQDFAFRMDGQSAFSLFPLLARPLVAALGVSNAAFLISVAGSVAWFFALVALAKALVQGRSVLFIIVVVAALSLAYGDTGILSFAETAALPRPFAEASVLMALAAMLANRPAMAAVWLAIGMALHPIMTLPGCAVVVVMASMRLSIRHQLIAGGLLLLATAFALALGFAGLPLFERIVTPMDSEWSTLLAQRSPYLFPTLWQASAFAPVVAQALTLAVAAQLAGGAMRRLFLAVMVVTLGMLAAAMLFGDELHLTLFIQVQLWRATWLLAAMGAVAFAFCLAKLWHTGPRGHIAMALLALAWLFQPTVMITLGIAVVMLLIQFGRWKPDVFKPVHATAIGVFVGILVLNGFVSLVAGYWHFIATEPPEQMLSWADPLQNAMQTVPMLLVTMGWFAFGDRLKLGRDARRLGMSVVTLVVGCTALLAFDQRARVGNVFEQISMPTSVLAMAMGRPHEILWVDGIAQGWFMAGRPQYLSPQQGSSSVFNRDLAMTWRDRTQTIVDFGLGRHAMLTPTHAVDNADVPSVRSDTINRFCARADAPGMIVFPINDTIVLPPLPGAISWFLQRPVVTRLKTVQPGSDVLRGFSAIPCAPEASSVRRRGR